MTACTKQSQMGAIESFLNRTSMNKKEQSTILIAGGAGFLGSHLCGLFLNKNFRVICLDNFITGSHDNIKDFQSADGFSLIEHNISQPIDISEKLDYIMNFASPASPIDYLKYPIETLKVGALGTHNILGIAKKHKARVLLASTSEVYGDPLVHPQPETYWGNVNPTGPRGVYDEAKRFAEALTLAYHRTHNIEVRIARIFNTYGPKMRLSDGRAIPNFIRQALSNDPITIYGDGSQTRSFCYVTDEVDGLAALLLSDYSGPVNIGNPDEYSVHDLATIIKELTGSKSEIIFEDLPADDPKIRKPDITLAKEELGWTPQTKLEDGLKETIKYFKRKL